MESTPTAALEGGGRGGGFEEHTRPNASPAGGALLLLHWLALWPQPWHNIPDKLVQGPLITVAEHARHVVLRQ
jgi:hypothetical protein